MPKHDVLVSMNQLFTIKPVRELTGVQNRRGIEHETCDGEQELKRAK